MSGDHNMSDSIKWKSTNNKQAKILTYLKKRKTPATLKQICLQVKIDKRSCDQFLKQLAHKGRVNTWLETSAFEKEKLFLLTQESK